MTNPWNHTPNHTASRAANHAAHTKAGSPARPGRGLRIAGWVAAAALSLLMITGVLATVVLLAVPFALWWVIDRAGRGRRSRAAQAAADEYVAGRRAEVESRAVVDAAGGCGWCGSRTAHRAPDGRLVMPREHHRADIEHTLIMASATAASAAV